MNPPENPNKNPSIWVQDDQLFFYVNMEDFGTMDSENLIKSMDIRCCQMGM